MICKICQEEIKEKPVIRGVKECEIIGCKNVVNYWYRVCEEHSKEDNICEICTARFKED